MERDPQQPRLATTVLVLCAGGLLTLGMVMFFSAGMTAAGAAYRTEQGLCAGLGLGLAIALAWLDYRMLRRWVWPLLAVTFVLLVLVLVVGVENRGARRWIRIMGFSLQPSELAKVSLIVVLAWYAERTQRFMRTFRRGILIPGLVMGPMVILVILERDVGGTLLLAAVGGFLLLLGGVRWRHLLPLVLLAAVALSVKLYHDPVRARRIMGWFDATRVEPTYLYQNQQAIAALEHGGLTGVGLGEGVKKYRYLPDHDTDFILAIIGEELGLMCTLSVAATFLIFLICGCRIAWRAADPLGMYLAAGLTFLIALQAFVNIGVVTWVLPNKGLPLPFISRGGSNLLAMMSCLGLLVSVARHVHKPARNDKGPALWEEMPAPQPA